MIKFLPFILVALLVLGGLGYFRFFAAKQSLQTFSSPTEVSEEPVEVPKTLPGASLEDRVKGLEDTITSLVNKVNVTPKPTSDPALDSRLKSAETAVTELKARVSSLEKASPAPAATSSKSTLYIPLGSGGGPWADQNWYSMPEYEISLDPANYPGYSGMVLEVTFRMVEAAGTGSVRLYNVTDGSAVSGQLDTTSTIFALKTSPSFTLSTGTKTYRLQVKSTSNRDIFIQSARIKVNF